MEKGAASEREGQTTETMCMAQMAAGETQALRPIFDRWKLPLLTYFYRALGSHADAEDLVLQTFARVYRAADRYRPDTKFSTWLFAVARRELLHELRRRKRKPVDAVAPEDLDLAPTNFSLCEIQRVREAEEQLITALQELSERERSALLLAGSDELSHAEIAAAIDVSTNHLNVILHRARLKLRVILSRIQ